MVLKIFTEANPFLKAYIKPFEIMGKHSLKIYLLHRPIIYGLIYSLSELNH